MLDAAHNPDTEWLERRAAQFRDQVARRLDGRLTEDEFRPLRLMNGVYLQLHAYMLRIAIPYGTLSTQQLRALATIAERWDKGIGHFTTRQNIQFNWPKLSDIPDILDHLASVGMHAVQTSGNTIRNVTADPFAGAAADEIEDPRPWAEVIRLWSTDHPEFQFLPRKFKIGVTGAPADRAMTAVHDIGLRLVRRDGVVGFTVLVGGGLGRTPLLAQVIRDFLPAAEVLPYIEAILAAYNMAGRRDNKYKARIKITVAEMGLEAFRDQVEAEFAQRRADFSGGGWRDVLAAQRLRFAAPLLVQRPIPTAPATGAYAAWAERSVVSHPRADYANVIVTLKAPGATPGDASAQQMRRLAELADRFGQGEVRVTQEQNLVIVHVARADLRALHRALQSLGLATANAGLGTDIVACPGMDYCTLATARSIPIAQDIAAALRESGLEAEAGALAIKISGCINACGHHHIGDIGILGLDRAGVENYQITLGGDGSPDGAALGERAGPGFAAEAVAPAIVRLLRRYVELREPGERFNAAFRRLGLPAFRTALYPEAA
ncbi:nitrite/sulfite reductase [Paracoccus suum]|uniref:Nitrite/sulfite reductase n=1 Tax=Paracoccus suum TaxID=2259340 RepID=A0A344PN92_9RHOB|nr:nitrite/sulfite reductase [Paracoccus suum]AXC50847.1 nitrite/sulfite reductase [Paracoccus suum]